MAKVHLIRTAETPAALLWDVDSLFRQVPGPMRFLLHEENYSIQEDETETRPVDLETFHQRIPRAFKKLREEAPAAESMAELSKCSPPDTLNIASWESLFDRCNAFREQYQLPDTDFVAILTTLDNALNWFSAPDPSGRRNLFVQVKHWGYFTGTDPRGPVTYQIATLVLKMLVYPEPEAIQAAMHREPTGCMMDFCGDRRDVMFKLRTADICPACLTTIRVSGTDSVLVNQVFTLMELIRRQLLFRERFAITLQPSRMVIRGAQRRIFLTDLGDLEIHLTPLEKAVYLLFLDHPEGIPLHSVIDHLGELRKHYASVSNADTLAQIHNRVADLASPLSNSMSEKISRIRRKFTEAVGDAMANFYIIQGPPAGNRTIQLDRTMVNRAYMNMNN